MIEPFVKMYREKGLNIMPLAPKSKFPYKGHEWLKYQTETCNEQFKEGENGAVFCGKTSGDLVVIDLDDKALANIVFTDFEAIKRTTLVVETGKGYHIYIKPADGNVPESSMRISNEKGQHIDIQSQGTYVLIPGSIHDETGKEYKIVSSVLDIEKMSIDKLIEKLGKVGFNVESKRRRMVEVLRGVKEGERNDSGFRLAMCARHFWDLKGPELLTILTDWNRKYVFPPMTDLEIKNIVSSSMSYDIDDIKFKDIVDDVKKSMKELTLKYDDKFWTQIQDHCKKVGVSRSSLVLHCKVCSKDMPNDPQNTDHKTHMITIKYK